MLFEVLTPEARIRIYGLSPNVYVPPYARSQQRRNGECHSSLYFYNRFGPQVILAICPAICQQVKNRTDRFAPYTRHPGKGGNQVFTVKPRAIGRQLIPLLGIGIIAAVEDLHG